jgi:uncharacterized protein
MSSSAETISDVYGAFGRGDIPELLAMLDENIAWRVPENLPHGGDFAGRDGVGRFFERIGENWEDLQVELDGLTSEGDRVVAMANIHGRLRADGEQHGYRSAHVWTLHDGVPVRFAEYVDAPVSLPAAHAVA